jgi:MoaA/NifB/PqqE/SkfB family radical SAM enzyme
MTCSIDGASNETYTRYRRRGHFDRVIRNIRTLNELKAKHRTNYPRLRWQFVAFGHNEHEIPAARKLAEDLNMRFYVKLQWYDRYSTEPFSPIMDREAIGKATGLGVADRAEYRRRYGRNYMQKAMCSQLWSSPQINWDGRVLGCCTNFWGDYGNAFADGLEAVLNNEKMNYARQMLLGKREAREDIPCTTCIHYEAMKEDNNWLTVLDVKLRQLRAWITGTFGM